MKTPFFSVVISLFNKEKFIKNTLKSVLDQSFKDFEIIIVNDGSTDNSLEVIKVFTGEKILLINQKNLGAAAARNNGMQKASAKYLALLDGDDIWESDYLYQMHDAIVKHPTYSVFSTAIAHKFGNKISPATYNCDFLDKISLIDYFRCSLKHSVLTSSSIIFNKLILYKTGYFDESIISGQDTDMWIRIGLKYKIVFINSHLVHYVHNKASLSNTSFSMKFKPKYSGYKKEESKNPDLCRFLNRNRFSLALMSKIHSDTKSFEFYNSEIDRKYLNIREKMLLRAPVPILNFFLWIKKLQGKKLYYKPLN